VTRKGEVARESPTKRPLTEAEKGVLREILELPFMAEAQRPARFERIEQAPWSRYHMQALIVKTLREFNLAGRGRSADFIQLRERVAALHGISSRDAGDLTTLCEDRPGPPVVATERSE
jgi:hypothetical protein